MSISHTLNGMLLESQINALPSDDVLEVLNRSYIKLIIPKVELSIHQSPWFLLLFFSKQKGLGSSDGSWKIVELDLAIPS
jgi:hypothetical protein